MNRPMCTTCPYWNAAPDSEHPTASCHRHAPSTLPLSIMKNDREGNEFTWGRFDATATLWPETEWDEWCGEHPDFPEYIKSLNSLKSCPEAG